MGKIEENPLAVKSGDIFIEKSAPVPCSVTDDLDWLNKHWRHLMDGERVGDIFVRGMKGFKYTSASQIIGLIRMGKKP